MPTSIDVEPAWRDDGRLPVVTVAIHDRLEALVRSVTPHYLTRIDIRIAARPLDRLRDLGRDLEAHREISAVVSADLHGGRLATSRPPAFSGPLVIFRPTVSDVLCGLQNAGDGPVALLTSGPLFTEIENLRGLLRSCFVQHRYTSIDEARRLVAECALDPVTTVVGDGLACDLAEQAGLTALLLPTQNTVRAALDEAIALIRRQRAEDARQERLGHLSRHLSDGVISTDGEDRILTINGAMATILGITTEAAVGKPLGRVSTTLAALPVVSYNNPSPPQPCRVRNANLLVSRLSVGESGADGGSTLICTQPVGNDTTRSSAASRHPVNRQQPRYHFDQLIGTSPAIQGRRRLAEQYASVDATVLITGESGTGKELFAQAMHNIGRRQHGPFVAINCAALPEHLLESELFGYDEGAFTGSRKGGKLGLFEIANTGTIFLDEIGDMPISLQTRLLRVLQEREVVHIGGSEPISIDVRIIAATNRELARDVASGRFRNDLYYRLNVCHLDLPSLRERREDIPDLALVLLDRARMRLGIDTPLTSSDALSPLIPRLIRYDWPGNIREMENLMERLAVCIATGAINEPDNGGETAESQYLSLVLPELYRGGKAHVGEQAPPLTDISLRSTARHSEIDRIHEMIAACKGNRTQAAKALGISRATLWRKLM